MPRLRKSGFIGNNYKVKIIIGLSIAVIIFASLYIYKSFAYYQVTNSYNIIKGRIGSFDSGNIRIQALYIENSIDSDTYTKSLDETFPKNNNTTAYAVNQDKSYCDNGNIHDLNYYGYGGYIMMNVGANKKAKCTIYLDKVTVGSTYTTIGDKILGTWANDSININQTDTPDFTKTAPIMTYQETTENLTGDAVISTTSTVMSGTGYTFDSSTGYYTLTGTSSGYYTVGNYTCNHATITSGIWCRTIYKITSLNTQSGDTYRVNGAIKYSFAIASTDNSLDGVYTAEDNYGTSYYVRGESNYNYLKYAGFFWRIVRINGDGTVRLIYQGTTATSNAYVGNFVYYNPNSNDNAYVGYMYGTPGSSSYAPTHANINNSTLKTAIDGWYENNIKDTNYEDYLADTLFCGDREIYKPDTGYYANGTGYGTSATLYMAYRRNTLLRTPNIICTNKNDRYTANDKSTGNGNLTYSIAAITIDELSLAGIIDGIMNKKNYLCFESGTDYWTMSPERVSQHSQMYLVHTFGNVTNDWTANDAPHGVRPVLNIRSDINITSGNGSSSSPFELSL